MVTMSCASGLDSTTNNPVVGLYANPLCANFGSLISTLRPELSDHTAIFEPKSETTRTSSLVRPNSAFTILPIPPLPLLMCADHCSSLRSQTRTFSSSASRTRELALPCCDLGPHRMMSVLPRWSPATDITRVVCSEGMDRMISREPLRLATKSAPGDSTGC